MHPLCVSALNTPPEMASARVFRDVIRAAFGGRNHASDLLLPRHDLTALFPAPAAARLIERGGQVRLACRITVLDATADAVTLSTRDGATAYSHVILAVAPQHLAGLAGATPALESIVREVSAYRYHRSPPLRSVRSGFPAGQPLFALTDGPAQFVFDRGQSHGQAGLLAFVASTATNLPANWLDQAEAQLFRIAQPGPAQWRKSIVEKQAGYACIPNLKRPAVRTPHRRMFLAGDYTSGPYPATLESATLSGVQSARALLEQL